MRDILFRGKDIDNGIFVTGYLIGNDTGKKYITLVGSYCKEVIPETVGQYTGVDDRNDKKIFENDIVLVYVRGYHTVCTVSWTETVAHFQLWQVNTVPGTPTALNLGNYDCEVIGNIHDNPELLKGE